MLSIRIKSKIDYLLALLASPFLRRFHDLVSARRIKITAGDVPLGDEVCIYLIFPHSGLLASHVAALEAMRSQAIAPVVVSNHRLGEADRQRLSALTHIVMERPNTGYDFGGYRDAILHLGTRAAGLKWLWLMNDSAWLIDQPEPWFAQARRLGRDFVGASPSLTRRKFADISEARQCWPPDIRHPFFHYGSYAVGIGGRVLGDSGFLRFWKRLTISNNKKLTVRRGEMGLTQWIIARGFSHGATHDFSAIEAELEGLPSPELDGVARGALLLRQFPFEQIRAEVLETDANTEAGRRRRIDYLLYLICRQGPAYTLAGYAIGKKGFHFLKKSPARLSAISKQNMVGLSSGLSQPQRGIIENELRLHS